MILTDIKGSVPTRDTDMNKSLDERRYYKQENREAKTGVKKREYIF